MPYPSPNDLHPLVFQNGTPYKGTVFLKPAIDHPQVEIGDYTYASDFDAPEDWLQRLAPYLFPHSTEKLILGKFCQIAHGVRFITASANHRYSGVSTYPFAVFDGFGMDRPSMQIAVNDTVIGHDVWFGNGAQVMPGARIGSGVIVAANAVVTGTVPDYAIVAGNPARVVRMRFPEDAIARLLELAWWDWPIDHILAHEAEIVGGDVDALEAVRPEN